MTTNRCSIWLALSMGAACGPGFAADSVRYELATNQETYEVGEPIIVKIELFNTGAEPIKVRVGSDITGRSSGYAFEVTNANGELLRDPLREYLFMLGGPAYEETISPGGSYSRELILNYRFPPLMPGRYSVKGVLRNRNGGGGSLAESNGKSFQIRDTSELALKMRVADLVKELRAGAGARRIAPLLGFTGHADAIAPLIDLLYTAEDNGHAAAVQSLLYLDQAGVRDALFTSLKTRGPRDRMVEHIVVRMRAKTEDVTPLLLPWLADANEDVRLAALNGIALANRQKDPLLFARLAAMLKDPQPRVRLRAASAVGAYSDAAALAELKSVLRDPDSHVREQATIAVGWVAQASPSDGALRKEAVEVLRSVEQSGGRPAEQAAYWLQRVAKE